jgi:hypothetical protein
VLLTCDVELNINAPYNSICCRWFAALGDYQREPWLVSLVEKLLVGGDYASDAMNLLDVSRYPFASTPPKYIRATLYHYDFTRYNHSWMQLRGVDAKLRIINESAPLSQAQAWWTREKAGEYLPALDANNPSVRAYLAQSHLPMRAFQSPATKFAYCEQTGTLADEDAAYASSASASASTSTSMKRRESGLIQRGLKRFICASIWIREYYDHAMKPSPL